MKLDKQRRLRIPMALLSSTGLEEALKEDRKLRLSVQDKRIVLYWAPPETANIEYHDVITVDDKGRIILTKRILSMLGKESETFEYIVSALQNQIIIRWKKADI